MQRLAITHQEDELWIEPDPEGEFVRADEAAEAIQRQAALIETLYALVNSVHNTEFDGVTFRDVGKKNWFDVRDQVNAAR